MNTTNTTLTEFEFATFVLGESLRGLTITFQIVILVLCIVFRNHQPLKSRSWFPIAYMLCKLFEQSINVCYLVPPAYFSKENGFIGAQVLCFLQVWVLTPLIIAIVMVIGLNFVRWIVLGMIARRKERKAHENMDEFSFATTTELQTYTENDSGELTARRLKKADAEATMETRADIGGPGTKYFKLLQFLMTKRSFALWIVLTLAVAFAVHIVHVVLYKGICYLDGFNYATELVILFIMYLGLLIIAVGDFIVNGLVRLGSCTKRWLDDVFFEDDPLLFRLELYSIVFACTIQACIEIVFVILASKPETLPLGNLLHLLGQILASHFGGLFAMPGIPLIFTIIWYVRSKNRDRATVEDGMVDLAIYNRSEETITQILASSDKRIATLFKQFTVKEFSVENVLLYYDIAKYKTCAEKNKIKFINYISNTYLDEKSSLQVNFPKDVLDTFRKKLKELDQAKIPENLFEDVMVELHQNLLDTYSRFYDSKEFKVYLLHNGDDKM